MIQWTMPALVGVIVTAALLAALNDWRSLLAALALQYGLTAVLAAQMLIAPQVIVKLLAGWLAVVILGLTAARLRPGEDSALQARAGFWKLEFPTGLPFRSLAALMVMVVAWTISSQPGFGLPGLAPAVNTAVYALISLGLLNLGLTEEPLNAGCGLLTCLTGFELAYAAVEPSLAVAALLVAVHLAVAMAVSYLALLRYAPPEANA